MAFARIEQEPSGEGFRVLLSEGSSFSITADVFLFGHHFVGQELDEVQCSVLQQMQERHNCRSQALSYLAVREHTKLELLQKLKNKGFGKAVITPVLETLEEQNLVSEYRYALLLIEHRQKKNPEGRAFLAQRLAAKGVNRQDAERALDELFTEQSIVEYVQKAYEQAIRKAGEEKARFLLQKKGFSSYEIRLGLEAFQSSR